MRALRAKSLIVDHEPETRECAGQSLVELADSRGRGSGASDEHQIHTGHEPAGAPECFT